MLFLLEENLVNNQRTDLKYVVLHVVLGNEGNNKIIYIIYFHAR